MVILNLFLVGVHVRTHVNIRPSHIFVGNYFLQVINMDMSNQKYGYMFWVLSSAIVCCFGFFALLICY